MPKKAYMEYRERRAVLLKGKGMTGDEPMGVHCILARGKCVTIIHFDKNEEVGY